jgi:phosphoglycolate phosphatase
MACKALIFDLDGTIWDSYPCYGAALECVSEYKRGNTIELLRSGENVMTLASNAKIGKGELLKLCKSKVSELTLFPGVLEGLQQLRARDVPLAVATNLPGWFVEPFLNHFGMEQVFAASVFNARKPSPVGLKRVMAELRVSGSNVCFVGDSESDSQAAISAGVVFGWAAYGYSGKTPACDHVRISQFSDVLRL